MTRSVLLAVAVLVAGLGLGAPAVAPGGGASAGDSSSATAGTPPSSVEDRATFTLRVERVVPGQEGRLCASRLGPDLNRVTVVDSRLENVTLWYEGERATRATVPQGHTRRSVLYTDGRNDLVTALARLDACLYIAQPKTITVAAYTVETDLLEGSDGHLVTGPSADDDVPEPGGLTLGPLADEARPPSSSGSSPRAPGPSPNASTPGPVHVPPTPSVGLPRSTTPQPAPRTSRPDAGAPRVRPDGNRSVVESPTLPPVTLRRQSLSTPGATSSVRARRTPVPTAALSASTVSWPLLTEMRSDD